MQFEGGTHAKICLFMYNGKRHIISTVAPITYVTSSRTSPCFSRLCLLLSLSLSPSPSPSASLSSIVLIIQVKYLVLSKKQIYNFSLCCYYCCLFRLCCLEQTRSMLSTKPRTTSQVTHYHLLYYITQDQFLLQILQS